MTLIECFTQAHVDNISACLRLKPEKVVFVGNAKAMEDPVNRYKALFGRRCPKTVVDTCEVDDKDCAELQATLRNLLLQAEECVIDMTGGEAIVAMAVGLALGELSEEKRKTVRVEWYDHATGMIVDCVNDNRRRLAKTVRLSVEELVGLHGGALFPETRLPEDCDKRDLDRLWRVVSGMPKEWNEKVSLLKRFEKFSEDKTSVDVDLRVVWDSVPELQEKEEAVRQLIEKLDREGVVADKSSYNSLRYTYNSDFLRYCVHTQGNVLEIKTLLEGLGVWNNNAPFFSSGCISVKIDWDGDIPASKYAFSGTRNEIDVMLMHGETPLFVSCKNGDVKTEELYKLHTVATRFGGPYAKKMLVVSDLDGKDTDAVRSLVCRAWDMDIFMVPDAGKLRPDQWQEIFKIPFSADPKKAMEEFLRALYS